MLIFLYIWDDAESPPFVNQYTDLKNIHAGEKLLAVSSKALSRFVLPQESSPPLCTLG
jgi:hypothetical protein